MEVEGRKWREGSGGRGREVEGREGDEGEEDIQV